MIQFESMEMPKVEVLESGVERLENSVPEALRPIVREFAELLESVGIEVEVALAKGFEFADALLEQGQEAVEAFVDSAVEWLNNTEVVRALGEYVPDVQRAIEAIGEGVKDGADAVETEHVLKAVCYLGIAIMAPEALPTLGLPFPNNLPIG